MLFRPVSLIVMFQHPQSQVSRRLALTALGFGVAPNVLVAYGKVTKLAEKRPPPAPSSDLPACHPAADGADRAPASRLVTAGFSGSRDHWQARSPHTADRTIYTITGAVGYDTTYT